MNFQCFFSGADMRSEPAVCSTPPNMAAQYRLLRMSLAMDRNSDFATGVQPQAKLQQACVATDVRQANGHHDIPTQS